MRILTGYSLVLVLASWVALTPALSAHQGHEAEPKKVSETELPLKVQVPGNKYCPVLPDEPVDPELFTEIDGKRVYVCCKKCLKQLKQNPKKYLNPPETVVNKSEISNKESTSIWSKVWTVTGRSHVVVIHFPIALIILAAGTGVMGLLFPAWPGWKNATEVLMINGSLAAVAAASLGWILADHINYQGEDLIILERHRWLGLTTAFTSVLSLGCWWLVKKEKLSYHLFVGLLFIVAILVGITGHYGGSLIYGSDYFTWK